MRKDTERPKLSVELWGGAQTHRRDSGKSVSFLEPVNPCPEGEVRPVSGLFLGFHRALCLSSMPGHKAALDRSLSSSHCCSGSRCLPELRKLWPESLGIFGTCPYLVASCWGPKGEDVTKLMASSLIRIEGWPPALLMEGCENQADSSITLRAEPGQPRRNELGCDGRETDSQEGPVRINCTGLPHLYAAFRGVEERRYLILYSGN